MTTDERRDALLNELAKRLDDLGDSLRGLSGTEPMEQRYLTTDQVAERLQVDKDQVLTMVKAGLPHYRVGKGFRFRWPEVIAFMQNFRVEDIRWGRTG